ncbi:protein takeout-like [Diaphorina citri]|uniref:Protein takeout-like n=1 Tax=Diaphorina citri TaxID=121845 RepID=A0A3Q0J3G3_DIACI|nr:protein takeout-like [Diaphorina citri]
MFSKVIFVVASALVLDLAFAASIAKRAPASELKVCKRSIPKYRDCFMESIQSAIPVVMREYECHFLPYRYDIDNYKFGPAMFDINHNVVIEGQYSIKGKIMVLPIVGNGKCNITLVHPKLELKNLQGKPFEKNGKTYIKLEKVLISISKVEKMYIHLENLFNGNKELSEQMNVFLNENWSDIIKELMPAIETALEAVVKEIGNRLFSKIAYEEFFPA